MSIVYNSGDAGDWATGTSLVYSFNNVAGDYMFYYVQASSGIGTINTPTYNGVALTRIGAEFLIGTDSAGIYQLISPATGAHNFSVTRTTSGGVIQAFCITLSGTRLSLQPEATSVVTTGSVNDFNGNIVTVTDNAWHVMVVIPSGANGNSTDTVGATLRATALLANKKIYTKPVTPVGSDNIHINIVAGPTISYVANISVAEFGAVPPSSGNVFQSSAIM